MKKSVYLAIISLFTFLSATALAHDFWLSESKAEAGAPLILTLGYGHNFPTGEEIPEENLDTRFQKISLAGPGGPFEMKRGAETNLLESDKPLVRGAYAAYGDTVPLFLTQTTEGWVIKAKNEVDEPLASNLSAKHAKAIIGVGDGEDVTSLSKPVGQKLEILPLADPARMKPADALPVRVIFDGRPLAGAEIAALAAGRQVPSFTVVSGEGGEAEVKLDRAGLWLLTVEHSIPYDGDRAKADNELNIATLTFRIGD
jgi:uncharacterized GH25 family protein